MWQPPSNRLLELTLAAVASVVGGALCFARGLKADTGAEKDTQAALNLQSQQYDTSRRDLYPWTSAGEDALAEMRKQLGLPPIDESKRPTGSLQETISLA